MRDRLTHLHESQTDPEGFSPVELGELWEDGAAAAAADRDRELEDVLQEAQEIRLEIQQIQSDLSELKSVNFQALNRTSHADAVKRDSNAIGGDIQRRGESALRRLHVMNAVRGELEAQRGSGDPTARIARAQYQCLSNALQEVMFSYNDTEMNHREACKQQMRRQMEVVGREVGEEELGEMMEGEDWKVFSIQAEGRTARSAVLHIETRHRELLDLERRIQEIQELFLDLSRLTEEQGAAVENIQRHVQSAEVTVQDGVVRLETAITADKNNPFKKVFCSCFPCYNN